MKTKLAIIKERGIINAIKFLYSRHRFLLKYRISVSKILSPSQLGLKHPYANNYEAVSHFSFNRMMQRINRNWEKSTFVDFGCGKGAAILLAEKFNFRQYIGIELSAQLLDCCLGNIRKYKQDLELRTVLVNKDAAGYEIPAHADVFYFFNPFQRPVLLSVLQNIEKSLQDYPRQIFILYVNAVDADLVQSFGYKVIFAEEEDEITRYGFGNYAYTK